MPTWEYNTGAESKVPSPKRWRTLPLLLRLTWQGQRRTREDPIMGMSSHLLMSEPSLLHPICCENGLQWWEKLFLSWQFNSKQAKNLKTIWSQYGAWSKVGICRVFYYRAQGQVHHLHNSRFTQYLRHTSTPSKAKIWCVVASRGQILISCFGILQPQRLKFGV